jgi:lipopolysaccharide export system protein LptA
MVRLNCLRLLFFLVLGCSSPLLNAQEKKARINFVADDIIYDETLGNKARRLIGNVVFDHEGVLMYCDSAYQYPVDNALDAFGNVHIKQGDTLDLYGDSLEYNGNTKIAHLRGNVKLVNPDITLTTSELIYYRIQNYCHYPKAGTIINRKANNQLFSNIGYFYPSLSFFHFKDSVRLINPDYTIETDTLEYNSETEITYFKGPTNILSDENLIYCENGWYDTKKNLSTYYNNAYLIQNQQKLEGDSLFYDRNAGYGEVFSHVQITDTVEKIIINGDYSIFFEANDSAIVIGDSTLLTQIFETDSLFLHADTFQIVSDTISDQRNVFAWPQVKFYKSDLQGRCDSMRYSFVDSVIQMFTDPIIWSGENQLTADYIEIRMANKEIHSIYLDQRAFIASQVDSVRFNQIRGKIITGYFKESDLYKVVVNGNGQTIYYSQDEEDKFIGVNRGESSDLLIFLENSTIQTISFQNDPDATFYPIMELSPEELRLKEFSWRVALRPTRKADIYEWLPTNKKTAIKNGELLREGGNTEP